MERRMNNKWNKIIYKIGAPIYDRFFNAGAFLRARKRVFEELSLLGRNFQRIVQPYNDMLHITENTPVLLNGMYRKIRMERSK